MKFPFHHLGTALAPFRHYIFTVLWLALLFSTIGTWIQSVGTAWLMAQLSPSPFIVSLVHTATTIPILLFALLAGALADIFNRRLIMLLANLFMALAALCFAVIVLKGFATPELILLFTFLLGTGNAFMAPAWLSLLPSIVQKNELSSAIALNGVFINISRAIGPVIGGFLIATYGISAPFFANFTSFMLMVCAMIWFNLAIHIHTTTQPSERVWCAIKAGIHYARESAALKATMLYCICFMFFTCALWGLLPLIIKKLPNSNAQLYGIMVTSVGLGAVSGVFLLPVLRHHCRLKQILLIAACLAASSLFYISLVKIHGLLILASYVFGIGWLLFLASTYFAAQLALPDWARARGIAMFMMVLYGSMALGAAFWGWVASITSIPAAMVAASVGCILFGWILYCQNLSLIEPADYAPPALWP